MANYSGSGPWRTVLSQPAYRWVCHQDVTEAVNAVLAHEGLLAHRVVSGAISSHPHHPLYLYGADGNEEIWDSWFESTPHRLHIAPPRRRPPARDLYVHSWQ